MINKKKKKKHVFRENARPNYFIVAYNTYTDAARVSKKLVIRSNSIHLKRGKTRSGVSDIITFAQRKCGGDGGGVVAKLQFNASPRVYYGYA